MSIFRYPTLFCQLLLLLCAGLFLNACGSDSNDDSKRGIGSREVPALSLSAGAINFPDISVGSEDRQSIRISNTGLGTLRLGNIELVADDAFRPGDPWHDEATLNQGQSIELAVIYQPTSSTVGSGKITLTSNDPNYASFEIPLRTQSMAARIFSPETVQFSRVPSGGSDWQISDIHNIGQAPLEIDTIVLTGSSDFSISYPSPGSSLGPIEQDSQAPPSTIAPDQSVPIRILFSPQNDAPSNAELQIHSNDAVESIYTISLLGNSGAPCMRFSHPDGVDFMQATIGRTAYRHATIENCSHTADLELSAVNLIDNAGGAFDLRDESIPDDSISIRPLESITVIVEFTPHAESDFAGELQIISDDPSQSTYTVDLMGIGTTNECPEARALARESEADDFADEVTTHPLTVVALDASTSSDTDGSINSYEWTILSRPLGSNTQISPTNTVTDPTIWLDLAGVYNVELIVYDDQGMPSCQPDTVRLHAIPGEEIHVQLVWDSPSVQAPEIGVGTDLDLHYLHPIGVWDQPPWDIYWLNPRQDWSAQGEPSIASLDIDDKWGIAPENVNHANPEDSLSYAVGVYYYADNGFGAAYATVRIYILGELREEIPDRQLQQVGSFWYVGDIQWPTGNFALRDQFYDGFP